MAKRLTSLGVENVRPGAVRREISDGGSGLWLIVQPSGSKSWALRYRDGNGRPCKLTLGSWPAISLAAARKASGIALHDIAVGDDPREAKKAAAFKAAAAKADTVVAVCEGFLKREGAKLRTVDQLAAALKRLVYPVIGDRPIGSIRRSDIVALLDKIEDERGQRMADVTLAALRRIFNWHATRSDDFVPPFVRGMVRQDAAAHRRSRILSDSELRAVWTAAAAPEAQPFGALVRLALLTSARRGELAGMQWDEIDADGIWTLPASRSKTKTEIVRPLSKAALDAIAQQPRINEWVLTATGNGPLRSFGHPKDCLDAASGVRDWRLHDLRRTARSLLSRAGVNSDVAERCLGHAVPGVRGVYDRHKYLDEMRHAFEALAAEIHRIVNPPADNVVPLHGQG
jgi:integrase